MSTGANWRAVVFCSLFMSLSPGLNFRSQLCPWGHLRAVDLLFHNEDCFFWERGNKSKATKNKSGASPLSIALMFCSFRRKKKVMKNEKDTSQMYLLKKFIGGGIIKQDFRLKPVVFFFLVCLAPGNPFWYLCAESVSSPAWSPHCSHCGLQWRMGLVEEPPQEEQPQLAR